jgi:hypothetical protein
MTFKNSSKASLGRFLAVVAGLMVLASCGGSGNGLVPTPVTSGSNVASVVVDSGPENNFINGIYTSVEVCAPGSTSNCATVPNVLVDTGSSGLRLLSAALPSLSLPSINVSGNPLQECIQFVDLSYIWGPVAQADVHLAGETASSVPIQLISASPEYAVPTNCLSLGTGGADLNSVQALGANGILGVGNLPQDCGSLCISAANNIPAYFTCPNGDCQIASTPVADQLPNPVALFATDNNGVLISLPSVPLTGAATATGSLIFGIGTQSNNALGSAQIYAVDANDDFTTTYNGVPYSSSYIDSGSNILYFLDSATLGNIDCLDIQGIYCPNSTLNFTVTNTGTNGTSGQVNFSIANGDNLYSSGNAAFNDLAGDSGTGVSSDYVDFGIPFFLGRNVFVGIAGKTVPNGASAPNGYWAY